MARLEKWISEVIFLCFVTVFLHMKIAKSDKAPDILSDYFWGSGELRSYDGQQMYCDSEVLQIICSHRCGGQHFSCEDYRCNCMDETLRDLLPPYLREEEFQEIRLEDFIGQPLLRHHIAHFCPMKKARACIRKCMESGQPAFCGKDHKCYCGHRYSSHDKNIKKKPEDVYAQYRDLYEKYFGPQVLEQVASSSD